MLFTESAHNVISDALDLLSVTDWICCHQTKIAAIVTVFSGNVAKFFEVSYLTDQPYTLLPASND